MGSQAARIEGRLSKRLEDEMRVRGSTLRRSRTNRIIGGVCGGLEEFFGLDAFWFRLGFVLALLPGGVPGIAIYLVMWLIMPSE
jgi:phage shock protein PspC (stress-responsive transcriptional regulator)